MAVSALAAMGACADRIVDWAQAYALRARLPRADARELKARERWLLRIRRDGGREALRNAIETLGDGLGAAAFHAVIRAAYALERHDDDDLAAAFESWEREFITLPIPERTITVEVDVALEALERASISRESTGAGLIADGMRIVGSRAGFLDIAAQVPTSDALDALATAAAVAFGRTGNFTALHMMTGSHAMRTLRAQLGSIDGIMPAFWRAYVAAAIVAGTLPALNENEIRALRSEAPPTWAPLLARAVAHDDEHVIKATYTAWCLDRAIADPLFRTAAARYLDRHDAAVAAKHQ